MRVTVFQVTKTSSKSLIICQGRSCARGVLSAPCIRAVSLGDGGDATTGLADGQHPAKKPSRAHPPRPQRGEKRHWAHKQSMQHSAGQQRGDSSAADEQAPQRQQQQPQKQQRKHSRNWKARQAAAITATAASAAASAALAAGQALLAAQAASAAGVTSTPAAAEPPQPPPAETGDGSTTRSRPHRIHYELPPYAAKAYRAAGAWAFCSVSPAELLAAWHGT